jgi:hypothetical protein
MKKMIHGQGGSTTEEGHSLPWKGGKKARAPETAAAMGSRATGIQGIMGGPSIRLPRMPGGLDGLVTLVGGLEAFKAGNAKIQPPDPRNTDVSAVNNYSTYAWICVDTKHSMKRVEMRAFRLVTPVMWQSEAAIRHIISGTKKINCLLCDVANPQSLSI